MTDECLTDLVIYYQQDLMGAVESFAKTVRETLRVSTLAIRPIITWRVKEPDSLLRKLQERYGLGTEVPLGRRNLNEWVRDLGGVRVIVHDPDDIARVVRVIEEQCTNRTWVRTPGKVMAWDRGEWAVRELRDNDFLEFERTPRGSYHSRHFVVRKGETQIRCEIQLRTVLEEAVFEAHHRLSYRKRQEGKTPSHEAEQVLGALTEMVAVADSMLADCYRWSRNEDG